MVVAAYWLSVFASVFVWLGMVSSFVSILFGFTVSISGVIACPCTLDIIYVLS